jgi:hypothetical protein
LLPSWHGQASWHLNPTSIGTCPFSNQMGSSMEGFFSV